MTTVLANLRSADDLVSAGLIAPDARDSAARVGARYAIALTPTIANLIDRDDATDPIARQFLPDHRELSTQSNERADPIGDHIKSPVTGLVHRYADRVLLKIASICPVYCRFCFRREMVGPELGEALTPEQVEAAVAYIAATPEIWEVILTGGDPLVLSARRLRDVTMALGKIDHVKILRWHTRVPVVDPARITDDVVAALKSSGKTVVIGLHTNHARELTTDARHAIDRLVDAGLPVVSQTVLLRGVNDTPDAMEALLRALVEARVIPYYLHHGDLAPGTAHLRTSLRDGIALMQTLRQRLSGLAFPNYVHDIPGAHGKVDVAGAVTMLADGGYLVRDSHGTMHTYRD